MLALSNARFLFRWPSRINLFTDAHISSSWSMDSKTIPITNMTTTLTDYVLKALLATVLLSGVAGEIYPLLISVRMNAASEASRKSNVVREVWHFVTTRCPAFVQRPFRQLAIFPTRVIKIAQDYVLSPYPKPSPEIWLPSVLASSTSLWGERIPSSFEDLIAYKSLAKLPSCHSAPSMLMSVQTLKHMTQSWLTPDFWLQAYHE